MPLDLLANFASTTVSSGGTDAPAAGAQESWTVASSTGFPTASLGNTQFRIQDPAAPTEIVLVLNTNGTTWYVERGAEGTTPVAHTSGFTVNIVLTAGAILGATAAAVAYDDGQYYPSWQGNGATTGSTQFSAGDLVVAPLYSPGDLGITALEYYVATPGSGDANWLVVYSASPATGLPDSLLASASMGASPSSAGWVASSAFQTPVPSFSGLGWVGYWLESATTAPAIATISGGAGSPLMVAGSSMPSGNNGWQATGVTGSAPPATFPSSPTATSTVPYVPIQAG